MDQKFVNLLLKSSRENSERIFINKFLQKLSIVAKNGSFEIYFHRDSSTGRWEYNYVRMFPGFPIKNSKGLSARRLFALFDKKLKIATIDGNDVIHANWYEDSSSDDSSSDESSSDESSSDDDSSDDDNVNEPPPLETRFFKLKSYIRSDNISLFRKELTSKITLGETTTLFKKACYSTNDKFIKELLIYSIENYHYPSSEMYNIYYDVLMNAIAKSSIPVERLLSLFGDNFIIDDALDIAIENGCIEDLSEIMSVADVTNLKKYVYKYIEKTSSVDLDVLQLFVESSFIPITMNEMLLHSVKCETLSAVKYFVKVGATNIKEAMKIAWDIHSEDIYDYLVGKNIS